MTPDDIRAVLRGEEHRLATAVRALADMAEPLEGGVCGRGAPGIWLNACFGAALDGDLTRDSVHQLVDFYAEAHIEPRIELATFVGAATLGVLAHAGFVVRGFDNVLARPVTRAAPSLPPVELPDGVTIHRVDPRIEEEVDRFARAALSGFLASTGDVAEPSLASMRRAITLPGTGAITAMQDGRIVGAAAYESAGDVTCLFGASVAPAARGRGIHRAMLAWRLRAAAEMGGRFATIGSRPGATTENNVRRLGFELAYTRTAFVRPGPGLVAIVE